MITYAELRTIIDEERQFYIPKAKRLYYAITKHKKYMIFRYIRAFRLSQYWYLYLRDKNHGFFTKLAIYVLHMHYTAEQNRYSYYSGIEIAVNSTIGRNIQIWHSGVVINATLDDNCIFHGNNIVGNKGGECKAERPVIGNNADFGAGAVAIGQGHIADGCIIGANAVASKGFVKEDAISVGIPAVQCKSFV